MGSCLIHQCDICQKMSTSSVMGVPKDWFEFDYEYITTAGGKRNKITYLICSLKCYIVQVDKCIHYGSTEHSNVRIAGMGMQFARQLIENVDVAKLAVQVERSSQRNKIELNSFRLSKNIKPNSVEFEDDNAGEFEEEIETEQSERILADTESIELYDKPVAESLAAKDETISRPENLSGKAIAIRVDSKVELEWLQQFAFDNSHPKLIEKMAKTWEHDNIVTYDSMIDSKLPTIPLIRYKSHYVLFLFENATKYFEFIKNKQVNNLAAIN